MLLLCYQQKIKVNLINVGWVMGVKKKNLKLEIKKMNFKNITLIWETETNLEERESVYLLSIFFLKLLMNSLKS